MRPWQLLQIRISSRFQILRFQRWKAGILALRGQNPFLCDKPSLSRQCRAGALKANARLNPAGSEKERITTIRFWSGSQPL